MSVLESVMEKRKQEISLVSAQQDPTTEGLQERTVWYDATSIQGEAPSFLKLLEELSYTGILLRADQLNGWLPENTKRLKKVLVTNDLDTSIDEVDPDQINLVASSNPNLLKHAKELGLATCLRAFVDSHDSLHAAIAGGKEHNYLSILFRDPTNIPLELVIASLQNSGTVLINEIADGENVEAALVVLGVMEVGADGVMFSPQRPEPIARFAEAISGRLTAPLAIEVATIVKSEPVGMGLRACIDLATMFDPTEGMLVGSTSQGGFLCCPEVFHLPYMELRPFRVNAGAVHSYVYSIDDTTNYISELRAGSPALIVGLDGTSRKVPVGRIKTELRPLRLLTAQFESGEEINILMQDDWHVRIFSEHGEPLNITHLTQGTRVLAHKASAGRHVGINIEEQILEV